MIQTPAADGIPVGRFQGRYGISIFFCDVSVSEDELETLLIKSSLEQGEPAPLRHVSGTTYVGELMLIPTEFTFVSGRDGEVNTFTRDSERCL